MYSLRPIVIDGVEKEHAWKVFLLNEYIGEYVGMCFLPAKSYGPGIPISLMEFFTEHKKKLLLAAREEAYNRIVLKVDKP